MAYNRHFGYKHATFGEDTKGVDLKAFGDTTGRYVMWDASADKLILLGAFDVGVDDTGHDVKLYGATSGSYFLWDESADQVVLEGADLQFGDNDILKFGDAAGGDVSIKWNATNLVILPAVDDTGAIHFGDGTTDMDLKVFLGSTTNYVEFDVGNKLVKILNTQAGGDSPKAMLIDVDVLAGNGYRQGGLQVDVNRAVGENFTWDGNPDCGIKILVNNRAANVANEGAIRALDVSARNRGTNVSWVNGINAGARNDSGMTAYQVIGIQTRVENYGTLETEAIGLDINMSIESDTGSPAKHGIQVRNTDASGMTVVDSILKASNTSTNGFGALLDLTGLAAANATLISTSGSAATTWAGRIRVLDASGTAAWINLYSTSNEA